MTNIFISYNRQSEATTRIIINDIETLGYSLWFDKELSGGQAWWEQILAKIRECDIFIFIMEPEALKSVACKREYEYASALNKPILPILVSEGVSTNLLPPALSQIQFVDYRVQDRDAAFRLARALNSVPPPEPLPNPLPNPPEVPISYLGNITEQVDTSSTLSYEAQSVLVVDLRRSLHNPDTADDAKTLLKRLRNRRDLFASIADEIDELLNITKKSLSVKPETEGKSKPIPPPIVKSGRKSQRGLAAVLGASIGIGVGIIIALLSPRPEDWIVSVIIDGFAGTIVGLINTMNKKGLISIIIGAILGFFTWLILGSTGRWLIVQAVVLGAAIGAILGAIAGRIIFKYKTLEKV